MKLTLRETFGGSALVFVVLLLIASIGGWIANIVKLVALLDGGVTGWMVGRIVGIFVAPLGSILGFL